MSGEVIALQNGRVSLSLHPLKSGDGPGLLLLHALWGSSADWGEEIRSWPGSVHGLDFCGHGDSAWVVGGAYSPELLASDADAALLHLGEVFVAGTGLGAYVALLLAGARPEAVLGTLLLTGPGLAGGGALPDFESQDSDLGMFLHPLEAGDGSASDPFLHALERDVRPADYAESFAHRARRLLLVGDQESVPDWWRSARNAEGARSLQLSAADAMRALAD